MTTTTTIAATVRPMYEVSDITEISFEDVKQSYRGNLGCACGCNGDYFYPSNEEQIAEVKKHLNYVNRAIKNGSKIAFFGSGVEVIRPSETSVTRIYFNDGIDIAQMVSGRISRQVKVSAQPIETPSRTSFHRIQKFSPTVIELGAADSVVITKDGKVVGFVEVKRVRNGNTELLANPVCVSRNYMAPNEESVYNSFATTSATDVDSLEDLASASNFIKFMNKENA
jgi:hypothetical protein